MVEPYPADHMLSCSLKSFYKIICSPRDSRAELSYPKSKIWVVFHPRVNNSIFIQKVYQTKPKSTVPNQTKPHQTELSHKKLKATTPH